MSAVLETREPTARYLEAVQPALVRRFELVATAPGGVARLRELILTLAVQGKLVEQDPSDEPADRLIARIHAARSKLVASGRIGKQKPSEPINEDETAFLLPKGWVWSRLGDLAWPQAGFAFKSTGFNESGLGLPLIRIRDVGAGVGPTTFFSGEYRAEFLVEKGDWLISMDGEFRVRPWHATTALLNQRVTRLVFVAEEVHASFVAAALQRELTALQGTKAYTTVDHLSGKQIGEAVIALPPANEQARIVARVDELMRLCDALETKGQLEAEQHARLLGTLLGTLTDSSTPGELVANWQRFADHFDVLFDRREAVDALEQTILQLAVRGLLVPQDSREAPASELLARIAAERSALVAAGELKRNWVSEQVSIDEEAFSAPTGWAWARTGDLVLTSEAGWSPTCHPNPRRADKWGVLKVSAVSWGDFDPEANKELPDDLSPRPDYEVKAGDFLLSRANTEELVARAVVVGEAPGKLMLSDKIIRLNTSKHCNRAFLCMSNNSAHTRTYYVTRASGTSSSMKNVSREVVLSAPVALPPIAEQRRIVARVTELRRLCAELRQRLAASQTTQFHLADALVAEVV